jgi:hypothetical protein
MITGQTNGIEDKRVGGEEVRRRSKVAEKSEAEEMTSDINQRYNFILASNFYSRNSSAGRATD